MPNFSWLAQEQELSAAALTVRAQTISPNDNGQLLWDVFLPRQNIDSVKLRSISTVDWRPVSDRREWNARGRLIHLKTPSLAEIELIPIEAFFKVGEREEQELVERTLGNEALFRQIIGADIPGRIDLLAGSNFRRIEIDAFSAWAQNQVVVKNPTTGVTQTVSYGFSATRYTTAATAWNNAAVNAYDEFIAWLESAVDLVGPIEGVVCRLASFKEIQKDAPQGINSVMLTRAQVEDRISQDTGSSFRFYIVENSLDVYNDGGTAVTRTKVWPAQRVAAVPAGRRVGFTGFAPVARAFDIARAAPDASIDVRGQTAYIEVAGAGRELTVECQVNAIPVPDEQKMCVINVGV